MNSILLNGKTRVENQTKTRVWEDLSLCSETSTKMLFKNSISDHGMNAMLTLLESAIREGEANARYELIRDLDHENQECNIRGE